MSKESRKPRTLTEDEMVTARTVSRRTLLAGAGVALGAAALAGGSRRALASENDMSDKASKDKSKGDKAAKGKSADKAEKDKPKKSKIETTRDKD